MMSERTASMIVLDLAAHCTWRERADVSVGNREQITWALEWRLTSVCTNNNLVLFN